MSPTRHIWKYRGHRLRRIEWGLWKVLGHRGAYFLHYRPRGRDGPCVRRMIRTGPGLTLANIRTAVRTIRSQIDASIIQATLNTPPSATVADYIAELDRRNRSPGHVRDVRDALTRFCAEAKPARLQDITPAMVAGFLRGLHDNGAAVRTQNKYLGHIRAWLTWAQRNRRIERNPTSAIPMATVEKRFKRFPMPDQMEALVEASSPYDAAIWTFLALTGLRRGSFLSLTPESFGPHSIRVPHTKRHQEWAIVFDDGCPLWGADLSDLGRRIWAERVPDPWYLRSRLTKSCAAAGLAFTLHGFRHSFCSWLAMMGEDLRDIQAWAHHATSHVTAEWYTHLRPRGQGRIDDNRASVLTMRSRALDAAGVET